MSTPNCKWPIMVAPRARQISRTTRGTSSNSSRWRRWVARPTASWLSRGRTPKITSPSLLAASDIYNKINHQFKEAQDLQLISGVETFPQEQQPKCKHLRQSPDSAHPLRPLFRGSHPEALLIESCSPPSTRLTRGWWPHVPLTSPLQVQERARHYTITTKIKANLT